MIDIASSETPDHSSVIATARRTEVHIVDIWTECAAWPHNKMAAGYPWMCKNPWSWRAMYFASKLFEMPWAIETRLRCGARFRDYIQQYDPDLVVSLHPLCQKKELLEFMKANGKILPIAYSSLAPLSEWRDGYTAMAGSKDESAKADGTPSLVSEVASKLGVSAPRLLDE